MAAIGITGSAYLPKKYPPEWLVTTVTAKTNKECHMCFQKHIFAKCSCDLCAGFFTKYVHKKAATQLIALDLNKPRSKLGKHPPASLASGPSYVPPAMPTPQAPPTPPPPQPPNDAEDDSVIAAAAHHITGMESLLDDKEGLLEHQAIPSVLEW